MSEPFDSYRVDAESDEYQVVSVVAVQPTWRDVWAILRGRYRAKVRLRTSVTVKGLDRALREVWSNFELPHSALFDEGEGATGDADSRGGGPHPPATA